MTDNFGRKSDISTKGKVENNINTLLYLLLSFSLVSTIHHQHEMTIMDCKVWQNVIVILISVPLLYATIMLPSLDWD